MGVIGPKHLNAPLTDPSVVLTTDEGATITRQDYSDGILYTVAVPAYQPLRAPGYAMEAMRNFFLQVRWVDMYSEAGVLYLTLWVSCEDLAGLNEGWPWSAQIYAVA